MFSEEALRKAAVEANDCLLRSLDAESIPAHHFSARFERKMRRLIRRARHPAAYRALARAVCVLLALILGSGVFLAVNPEARAAFFGWVRTQYSEFFVYFFPESAENSAHAEYTLGWLPEGYHESARHTSDEITRIIYTNDIGDKINFLYSRTNRVHIAPEDNDMNIVQINGCPAELYRSQKDSGRNNIVWKSSNSSYIFEIVGNLADDILIRMAENVQSYIDAS